MKKYKILTIAFTLLLVLGCEQEPIDLKPAEIVTPETPTGEPGSLDLTKFATIGTSLTAGTRSGALFTDGQNESLGKIMAKQLAYAGGSEVFNQPDINSVNGFSGFIPSTTTPLGRLILFDPDGTGPRSPAPAASATPARVVTCPSTVSTPALPAPYNTATSPLSAGWAYTGSKAALNNFGVPGITVGELFLSSSPNPAFGTYYGRFASNYGSSTILGDAIAANPTFFSLEIGANDVLGYATGGASNPTLLTSTEDFNTRYNGAINTLLGNLPNAKGVVSNIPNVTSVPYFFTVTWNSIPLDNATATALNTGFAGFNQILTAIQNSEALKTNFGLTSEDLERRKVTYAESKTNKVLIDDETLTDLGPVFDYLRSIGQIPSDADRDKLRPYEQSRPATANDLITLPAGGILGTCAGGNAQAIYGLSVPLTDNYVLIPSETQEILTRTAEFNAIIEAAVNGSNNRLALANLNTAFSTFVTNKGAVVDGYLLTPSITPPYAAFSEDGFHPNGRGYAYLANIFIDAINAKFGSTIPKAKVNEYTGNRTPISVGNSY